LSGTYSAAQILGRGSTALSACIFAIRVVLGGATYAAAIALSTPDCPVSFATAADACDAIAELVSEHGARAGAARLSVVDDLRDAEQTIALPTSPPYVRLRESTACMRAAVICFSAASRGSEAREHAAADHRAAVTTLAIAILDRPPHAGLEQRRSQRC
jgi:hypothetical protein